jgi:hypothetical protein
MRIGVVGTGNMGRGLGLRWAAAGHEICFGARRPEAAEATAALSTGVCTAGTLAQAARFGPVVLWTVPDVAPGNVVGDVGDLVGRVVIDLTNGPTLPDGGSRAQMLQAGLPGSRVVKAFNTSSFESLRLSRTEAQAQGVQTLLAGDDPAALRLVASLSRDLGIDPIPCGGLADAADVEGAARMLIGRIVERDAFLLRLAITSLQPAAQPARLGDRTGVSPGPHQRRGHVQRAARDHT